eukprot:GHVU01048792.1.p2 GENE.GHVU01048792.1~~GHVU01048792.1.p2  ORF type:complete len:108 (-),score=5.51 GHVU01048792.1:585-908(-)
MSKAMRRQRVHRSRPVVRAERRTHAPQRSHFTQRTRTWMCTKKGRVNVHHPLPPSLPRAILSICPCGGRKRRKAPSSVFLPEYIDQASKRGWVPVGRQVRGVTPLPE